MMAVISTSLRLHYVHIFSKKKSAKANATSSKKAVYSYKLAISTIFIDVILCILALYNYLLVASS
jgi:hypothetical protein